MGRRRMDGARSLRSSGSMDAPSPSDQELKLDPWGLWILSPLQLCIFPDLSVELATFLDKLENMVQIYHLYIQSFHFEMPT